MMGYTARMDILRSGGTLASSAYDPNADMMAHSSSLRRPVVETETYLSKTQLEDLRRVQNERIEFGKRKTLGMDVTKSLGVRMDGNSESLFSSLSESNVFVASSADSSRFFLQNLRNDNSNVSTCLITCHHRHEGLECPRVSGNLISSSPSPPGSPSTINPPARYPIFHPLSHETIYTPLKLRS